VCVCVCVLRARVEMMGSHKCRIVGKSQPVLVVINSIDFSPPALTGGGEAHAHRLRRDGRRGDEGAAGASQPVDELVIRTD
jgi:hypothetical protein